MAAIVGVLTFRIDIPECFSLKGKRSVVKRLIARLKNRFNVSVAEIGLLDIRDKASIAVVSVSKDMSYLNSLLDKIVCFLDEEFEFVLEDYSIEFC